MEEKTEEKIANEFKQVLGINQERQAEIENSIKEAIEKAGKPLKPLKALKIFCEQKKYTNAEMLYAGITFEYHVHNIIIQEVSSRTGQPVETVERIIAVMSWSPREDILENGIAG